MVLTSPSQKTVVIYQDKQGYEPFLDWFNSVKDKMIRARIQNRLRRLEQGHYGDWKVVGQGIFELRLQFGSGYRIYYGEHEEQFIILLSGGDKKTQKKDIKRAQDYWCAYQESLQ